MMSRFTLYVVVVMAVVLTAGLALAGTLDEVRSRGHIIAGVNGGAGIRLDQPSGGISQVGVTPPLVVSVLKQAAAHDIMGGNVVPVVRLPVKLGLGGYSRSPHNGVI